MATALLDWTAEILLQVQGVPNPLIQLAVRQAAIELCEETLIWSEDLTRINVVSGTGSYTLTPPALSRLIAIDSAYYKATSAADTAFDPLDAIPQDQKDLFSGTTAWKFETGTPVGYYHQEEITPLYLYPIPDANATSGLLVRVHLIPTVDTITIDDFLWSMHKDALTAGALAFIFGQKDMPWYDPNKEGQKRQMFIGFMDNILRKMGRKYIPKADKEARPKT